MDRQVERRQIDGWIDELKPASRALFNYLFIHFYASSIYIIAGPYMCNHHTVPIQRLIHPGLKWWHRS
jgi:hypothetical protein